MVWLFVCGCLCVSDIGNSAVRSCFKGVREWCGNNSCGCSCAVLCCAVLCCGVIASVRALQWAAPLRK